jgi:hypothetical protein
MPSLETQLLNAVAFRNELAVALANRLLNITLLPMSEIDRLVWGSMTYSADIADIEALNAAILLRAGASWEAMAFHLSTSRQAVHRRLAMRGEDLFAEATATADERTTDAEALISTFVDAEALVSSEDEGGCYELLATLGPLTHEQAYSLLDIQEVALDILRSPRTRTDEVLELRKMPGGWMPRS